MKIKLVLAASILLLVSVQAGAAIVTYGNLTSDDSTFIITDTSTGREYLRFDRFNLSYADTLLAVRAGGFYEGWSIADATIADMFVEGLFTGSTPCSGIGTARGTECGILSDWIDGDFGDSYHADTDYFAFLNNNERPIGLVAFGDDNSAADGRVTQHEGWSYIYRLNNFGVDDGGANPINLLLTREGSGPEPSSYYPYTTPSTVPVPAAIWLFGSALIGLVGFSQRRKAA
jgi:hypothetical protein